MITFAAIGLILKRLGYLIIDHWRIFAVIAGVVVLGIVFMKFCGRKPAKLNEAEIIAAQQAIEERDTKKLKEILAVADVREANIDANVSNAATQKLNTLAESRDRYDKMTADELAAELEKRK